MAKLSGSSPLVGARGRVGRLLVRQLYGQTIVGDMPAERRRKAKGKEAAQNDRFAMAAKWAKFIPAELAQRYLERSRVERRPAFGLRIRDYLRAPVIEWINLAGYNGLPGDAVLVRAADDFEVKRVLVTLRLPGGSVFASGEARRVTGAADSSPAGKSELFLYTVESAPAEGAELLIEVVAEDNAGNRATATATLVVPRRSIPSASD